MDFSAAAAVGLAKPANVAAHSDPDERVAAIYAAHYQRLVGLGTMLGGGKSVGEEIAQETFVIRAPTGATPPGLPH